jgi:hypothetical protein
MYIWGMKKMQAFSAETETDRVVETMCDGLRGQQQQSQRHPESCDGGGAIACRPN